MPQISRAERGRPGTREALLDAVDALMAERGWAACSLQEIARRAGLTTGAVYSAFGSRGALLAAAMLRRVSAVAQLPADEPDLARAVAAYARTYYAMGSGTAGARLVTAQLDLLRLSATDSALESALRQAYTEVLEGMAAELQERGGAKLPAPPLELAHRMVAVLQGLTLQQIALSKSLGERAFVDAALTAVGLPPKSRTRR